ncbi:MAG: hypothetical protein QXV42_01230 [Ignisphaera sp.]
MFDIKFRRTPMELFGQTYASPEHFIRYREFIGKLNPVLRGAGELILGLSFREKGNPVLILHEYAIKSKHIFESFEVFVEKARQELVKELWRYVDVDRLGDSINIPKSFIDIYVDTVINEKMNYIESYVIESYVIPDFEKSSDPLIALISMHLLLDMLISFYKKLGELEIPSIGGIVRFEKKIMISTTSNIEEEYISINRDELEELKNKGIKAIAEKKNTQFIEHIGKKPSTIPLIKTVIPLLNR